MKTIYFKIAIAGLILMLGIITYLVFTSPEYETTEKCPITKAWYHHGPNDMSMLVESVNCDIVDQGLGLCTVTILNKTEQLYDKDIGDVYPNIILYKCAPK